MIFARKIRAFGFSGTDPKFRQVRYVVNTAHNLIQLGVACGLNCLI